jgi:hypothetical protein
MGMVAENGREHPVDGGAALVQGPECHVPLKTDQFERGLDGNDVPARIPPRVFISRRQINAAKTVELAEETIQTLPVMEP